MSASKPHFKQFSTWADLYRHAEQLAQQLEAERRRAAEATSKWEFWVDEAHRLEEQVQTAEKQRDAYWKNLNDSLRTNGQLKEQFERLTEAAQAVAEQPYGHIGQRSFYILREVLREQESNPASGSTERSGNWALVVPEEPDPASEPKEGE